MPDTQLYWSTDSFYSNPVISEVMTLKRFKKIIENLHVSDPRTELPRTAPGYDKLCKVKTLVNTLNKTFGEACSITDTIN